ncbi:hypothetical protein GS506_22215 [Rhodococcus hoagii]|nr:hypothetical protein [Prescottella equi]
MFRGLTEIGNMPKQLTYNQFVKQLDKGELKSLEIHLTKTYIW